MTYLVQKSLGWSAVGLGDKLCETENDERKRVDMERGGGTGNYPLRKGTPNYQSICSQLYLTFKYVVITFVNEC